MTTASLFLFILLATTLVCGAVNVILTLFGSMDTLLEKSDAAHFVQLHAGEIEQTALDSFTYENKALIKEQQTVELLGINGSNIYLGDRQVSEADSVMENSFVTQNEGFDYLLDTNSQRLEVLDGQIAVPIYHMQKYDLQVGDQVRMIEGDFQKEFTIVAFSQDSLMNPSMINSKRFLVSHGDWEILKTQLGEIEYMIEFQLHDTTRLNEMETLYQDSMLPQKGTAMGYSLVKVINGLSDGIAVSVIILIAFLLMLIAALCLRFTMLTVIEEDYREIGGMKAIGISGQSIRKLYMAKYVAIAVVACTAGYLLSLPVGQIFTENIHLYMGQAKKTLWNGLFPFLGALFVMGAIIVFCMIVLRRFRRITALEALRWGRSSGSATGRRRSSLSRSPIQNVNIALGVKEVVGRFSVYGLLSFVFVICTFLLVVPLNFLNTLESPTFVSYMGAGQCDLRIDLQQTEDICQRFAETEAYLEKDDEVEKYVSLYTGSFKAKNSQGTYDNLKVEIGDFTIFPLNYTVGGAPQAEDEIALSAMNAEEYQKEVGDTMTLMVEEKETQLTVCGIYQDVTNGGKTAKAMIPLDKSQAIWFTINIDLKDGVSFAEKQQIYSESFRPGKVTDVGDYVYQTMGGVIEQLRLVVKFSFALAFSLASMITAMFFKMLFAKEAEGIIIMKRLGFTAKHIFVQYLTRALLTLATGVVIGTWSARFIGEILANLIITGVSEIQFVVHPLSVYFLCPVALVGVVVVTMIFSSRNIRTVNILTITE